MSGKKDVFGHKYLSGAARYLEQIVRQRIGCKVRAFDLNLPQRCASYLISETDRKESIDSGRFSVRYMKKGKSGIMVSFFRRDDPYTIDFECVDIDSVANKVKTVPASFISESGNMVNERCIEYLLPLIKGEADLHYVNGIPRHFKLR